MAQAPLETDVMNSASGDVQSISDSSIAGNTQSQSGNSRSEDDYSTGASAARRENLVISSAKLFVLFFLLSLAVVVSYLWYQLTKAMEEDSYQDGFNEHATRL